ncbi:MAG: hypothetical protein ACPLYX_10795 [Rectinema subterraneum]|uniref:hypothetical protein n=1 Tax=Rectinema subterraneum TaxID=2653714 RepID=UPI003C7C35CB
MIYYTLVGRKSDTTRTGGDTPARPRLQAPRTACGRDENERNPCAWPTGRILPPTIKIKA